MAIVSVIVPAYNAERTILKTIESVQQQTFTDFELIVINDGSTDRTVELLKSIHDPRLKVFSYPNGGLPVARNRGIAQATGEFLSFLDADDLWTVDKLELQVAKLREHPEAGLAYSGTSFMDEQGESFHPGFSVFLEGNVFPKLLMGNFLANGSNPLIRRTAIDSVGGFDPTLKSCEDWDYWLRLALQWPFVVVPKPQILYRQSSSSMSAKIEVMEKYHLIVIEKIFQITPSIYQSLKRQSLANLYQFLAHLCLTRIPKAAGANQARQKLAKAIRLYPPVLLNRTSQVLVLKLLLIGLLSPKIASSLLQFISSSRSKPIQA